MRQTVPGARLESLSLCSIEPSKGRERPWRLGGADHSGHCRLSIVSSQEWWLASDCNRPSSIRGAGFLVGCFLAAAAALRAAWPPTAARLAACVESCRAVCQPDSARACSTTCPRIAKCLGSPSAALPPRIRLRQLPRRSLQRWVARRDRDVAESTPPLRAVHSGSPCPTIPEAGSPPRPVQPPTHERRRSSALVAAPIVLASFALREAPSLLEGESSDSAASMAGS